MTQNQQKVQIASARIAAMARIALRDGNDMRHCATMALASVDQELDMDETLCKKAWADAYKSVRGIGKKMPE